MKILALVACSSVLLTAGACSSEAWYEGTKSAAENDCRRQPPAAVDECMARVNRMRYRDYEQQRSGSR